MTVEDTDKIDIYAFGEDGVLRLILCDHLPWGDNEHLYMLQEKLNSYIAFVESGQCYEEVPKARGAPVEIELVAMHELDESAKSFLFRAGEIAGRAGIPLTYRVSG